MLPTRRLICPVLGALPLARLALSEPQNGWDEFPIRLSGRSRVAIAWSSSDHGSASSIQQTKAFADIQSERMCSPRPNVIRPPLPTRRSSIPRRELRRHPRDKRRRRAGSVATVVVPNPRAQALFAVGDHSQEAASAYYVEERRVLGVSNHVSILGSGMSRKN